MTPQELAGRAADVLRERGHCKHLLEDAHGHVCAAGALNVAASGNAYACGALSNVVTINAALSLVDEAMREINPDRGWLVSWNNHPDTTAEEVIAAFERVAGIKPEVDEVPEERQLVLA